MRSNTLGRSGFSLIELLVVIAIIGILAALLFPVFNRAREGVRQTTCMTQMHDLYVALHIYELDQKQYPAALLGFVQANGSVNGLQFYSGNGTGQPVTIANLNYKPLFQGQKPLNNVQEFACPDAPHIDPGDVSKITSPVYPTIPGSPYSGQQVQFTSLIQHNTGNDSNANFPLGRDAYFYNFDSYDTGPALQSDGTATLARAELHYSLDWTGGSGSSDNSNQLKYPQTLSPDRTVVTWCNYHVAVNHADNVLVLFLSGSTKPVNAKSFYQKGPLGF